MIKYRLYKALNSIFFKKIQQLTGIYSPTLYLQHHFLQSFYDLQSPQIQVQFKRQRVFFTDGGHISLDWLGKQHDNSQKPIVLIMHGMTGGSQTKYIRALAVKAVENNYMCVCINGRGINSQMTSPIPFVGYGFHQLQQSIKRVSIHFPKSPIHIIGTSLGGNFVLRYLLSTKVQQISSLSLVSAPFDVKYVIDNMHPTYQRFFIKSYIQNSVCRHKEMNFWWENNIVDLKLLKQSKNLRDFHQRITTKVTGYDDVDKFFEKFKINNQDIQNFKLDTFILTSEDDPMVHYSSIPIESIKKNKNIKFLSTKQGGHLCWFQGFLNPQRWYPKPIFEFINFIQKSKQNNKTHTNNNNNKQNNNRVI